MLYITPQILFHTKTHTHIAFVLQAIARNQILALTGLDLSRGFPCTEIGNENCLLYHRQEYSKHRYKIGEVTCSIISDHDKWYQPIIDLNNPTFISVAKSGRSRTQYAERISKRAWVRCGCLPSHQIGLSACGDETKHLRTFIQALWWTDTRWISTPKEKAMDRQTRRSC